MKRQAFLILTTLSLFVMLTATSVYAQSGSVLVANIPFDFVIGNKTFPAGEYVFALAQLGGSDAIKIQNADGHNTAFVPTRSEKAHASQPEPKLVFNRYGDQYFLSKVWTSGNDTGYELGRPRAERELIRSRITTACSASEFHIVSIIAHR
jgi:hypothetical protein